MEKALSELKVEHVAMNKFLQAEQMHKLKAVANAESIKQELASMTTRFEEALSERTQKLESLQLSCETHDSNISTLKTELEFNREELAKYKNLYETAQNAYEEEKTSSRKFETMHEAAENAYGEEKLLANNMKVQISELTDECNSLKLQLEEESKRQKQPTGHLLSTKETNTSAKKATSSLPSKSPESVAELSLSSPTHTDAHAKGHENGDGDMLMKFASERKQTLVAENCGDIEKAREHHAKATACYNMISPSEHGNDQPALCCQTHQVAKAVQNIQPLDLTAEATTATIATTANTSTITTAVPERFNANKMRSFLEKTASVPMYTPPILNELLSPGLGEDNSDSVVPTVPTVSTNTNVTDAQTVETHVKQVRICPFNH